MYSNSFLERKSTKEMYEKEKLMLIEEKEVEKL